MSNIANNMFKAGVFAIGLFGFALISNAADETCDPMPDCESLGYVKDADCQQNTYISCPYDASYKRCVNSNCESLGYTVSDKKSWCKEIIPCPTDASYTLCKQKCADCTTGERAPYCPFGRLSAGTDECGNQCYTCAECIYDSERGYNNDEYASLQCSTSQYVTTIIKPLCPENTIVKYVCEECPVGMIAPSVNSTSCICDEANGYYRACPEGAYCKTITTTTFGTCYQPTRAPLPDQPNPPPPPGPNEPGGSDAPVEPECPEGDPNCTIIIDPCEANPEECSLGCEDNPDDCDCDPRKGFVAYTQSDPHFTYSGQIFSFQIGTEVKQCKMVLGCSGYEGSTDSPVFDTEHFNKTYFDIYERTRGSKTCYWVHGCTGNPYVEKTGASDPCCEGRIYSQARTQGGHTCGVCPCDESKAYYNYVPVGRLYTTNNCSYQTCNRATACDVDTQHYSSVWSDQHFNYGSYVELPKCKEVLSCNADLQGAKNTDFTAVQKSYFTTAKVTNGARTCYYVTGCNAANNPKREDNCNAVELKWVSGDPQQLGGYTCGTCECDKANGYYETCPAGAVCETVGRCKKTKIGGSDDPDNDGCNNSTGYVPSTVARNDHFIYGGEVSFNIGSSLKTCIKVTGCNSSKDGSTATSSNIKSAYYTSTSLKIAATTCYWVTGCTDTRLTSTGACSTARGYKDNSCLDYGNKHCCICDTLTCNEQYSSSTPSYIVHTTSSSIANYSCELTDKKQADSPCYDCVCNSSHCNGTNCGTATVSCPSSTYPYTYCQHASRGKSCAPITRESNTSCNTDYATRYEKCDCINNGSNECYKRNAAGTDCTPLTCSDYSDYPLESGQRDTTRYTYSSASKCSGTGTRTCYKKTGCNTSYGHYNSSSDCLNANPCASSCTQNTYGCYEPDDMRTCDDDGGRTSYCNANCYICTDVHEYCGMDCYKPVSKDCGNYTDYPLSSCPADHSCDQESKKVGNDAGTCSNKPCFKDLGCASGYYDTSSSCLEDNPGYETCTKRTSGCYVKGTAKTCEYYGYSTECDTNAYDCSDTESFAIGDTTQLCYNPVPKGCPADHPVPCEDKDTTCYKYTDTNVTSGTDTLCCAHNDGKKTCSEINSSYITTCPTNYVCNNNVDSCSLGCKTLKSCDSSHCGSSCSTSVKSCSDYSYSDSDLPLNSQGLPKNAPCEPITGGGTYTCSYPEKRWKGWECKTGYHEANGRCVKNTCSYAGYDSTCKAPYSCQTCTEVSVSSGEGTITCYKKTYNSSNCRTACNDYTGYDDSLTSDDCGMYNIETTTFTNDIGQEITCQSCGPTGGDCTDTCSAHGYSWIDTGCDLPVRVNLCGTITTCYQHDSIADDFDWCDSTYGDQCDNAGGGSQPCCNGENCLSKLGRTCVWGHYPCH